MAFIPTIRSTGSYQVELPWALSPTVPYTCIAIRTFNEFVKQGVNVYDTFYSPMGVDKNKFNEDTKAGVVIVALESQLGEIVYIPSSYILSLPSVSGVGYAHRVMTISLGMLPDDLDLSALKSSVRSLVEARIGVLSEIHEASVPHVGVVSDTEHQALEQARAGRITEPTTDQGRIQQLVAQSQTLQQQINTLLAAALANNLVQTQ